MELMPAWMRQGYERGLEEGLEKGIEKGVEKGVLIERHSIVRKLISKGFSLEEVAETIEMPIEVVQKLKN